ncbi:MAG: hypothetical protein IPM54_22940 [Polyangiaceae bacterium]|nr:hypothetical protein [Polyangiaceae bacterium]
MRRKLLGICGFLLFGTFGMLSGIAQVRHDEPSASSQGGALQADVVRLQDMSPEEKERRRQECDTMEAYCRDWCGRSKQGQKCYDDCWRKYVECLKKIPHNPPKKPDY